MREAHWVWFRAMIEEKKDVLLFFPRRCEEPRQHGEWLQLDARNSKLCIAKAPQPKERSIDARE